MASDRAQLAATFREHWVHRHGDVADPDHAAIRRTYRECFTPNDPVSEAVSLDSGRILLDRAIDAVHAD